MQPSGRQRQLCRNFGDLSAPQFLTSQLRGGLLNSQSTQGWGGIGLIPEEELRALARERPWRGEMVLVPEAFSPSPVDSFDHVVALRLTRGNEERLDAQIQSQAHEAPEGMRGAPQAGESPIVIKLQEVRQPRLRATGQQVFPGRLRAFVWTQRLHQSMRAEINGVKDKDLLSASEIALGPIAGEEHQLFSQLGLRIIGRFVRVRWRVNQARLFEPTFNGREPRGWIEQAALHEFLVNRARPDMAGDALLQALTHSHHQLDYFRRVALGGVVGSFRQTI